MCLHDLTAHFFLALNNIPLPGCITVYSYIRLWKDILVAFSPSIYFLHIVHGDLTHAYLTCLFFAIGFHTPQLLYRLDEVGGSILFSAMAQQVEQCQCTVDAREMYVQ